MVIKKKIKYIGFEEFEDLCRDLANILLKNKYIKNIYGVPRSGSFIAHRLSYLTGIVLTNNPTAKHTAIIDSIISSGATRHSFANFPLFFPLIDKQYEHTDEWIEFWWEAPL